MTDGWVDLYGAVFSVSTTLILLCCLLTSLQKWSNFIVKVAMAPFSSTLARGIISRGVHYGRGCMTSLAISVSTSSTATIRSRKTGLVRFPGTLCVWDTMTRMVVISTIVTRVNITYMSPDWTMQLTTKFTVYSRINVWYDDYTRAPLTFTRTSLSTTVVMVITFSVTSRF